MVIFVIFVPTTVHAFDFQETVFIPYEGRPKRYIFEMEKGDVVKWEFRTFNDSFQVMFSYSSAMEVLSEGLTSDDGYFIVIEEGYNWFLFRNIDQSKGGFLEIVLTTSFIIPGFNNIIITCVIICYIGIAIFLKRRICYNA